MSQRSQQNKRKQKQEEKAKSARVNVEKELAKKAEQKAKEKRRKKVQEQLAKKQKNKKTNVRKSSGTKTERYRGSYGIREIIFKGKRSRTGVDAFAPPQPQLLNCAPPQPQLLNCAPLQAQAKQVQMQPVQCVASLAQGLPLKLSKDPLQSIPEASAKMSDGSTPTVSNVAGSALDLEVKVVSKKTIGSNTTSKESKLNEEGSVDAKPNFKGQSKQSATNGDNKHTDCASANAGVTTKKDSALECVGVIFTIAQSSSYDQLFQRVKQDAPEGEIVRVYEVESAFIPYLHAAILHGRAGEEGGISTLPDLRIPALNKLMGKALEKAMADISDLEPESVVINFECCSNCSSQGFSLPRCAHTRKQSTDPSVEFIAACVAQGFLVMISDFSLKALCRAWNMDHPVLGLNPFVQLGSFSSSFELGFNPDTLVDCCSAQLKILAEISEESKAEVKAMSQTIIYGVNNTNAKSSGYSLEVLTVMTKCGGGASQISSLPRNRLVTDSAGNTGAAGHIALTYPSGGVILASAGHWIELQHVKTSEEAFFRVIDNEYGNSSARTRQMKAAYAAVPEIRKSAWLQRNVQQQVQSRSAAKYSVGKSSWGRK